MSHNVEDTGHVSCDLNTKVKIKRLKSRYVWYCMIDGSPVNLKNSPQNEICVLQTGFYNEHSDKLFFVEGLDEFAGNGCMSFH